MRENEIVQANFVLALDALFDERYAEDWCRNFAKMECTEFEKIAQDLVGPRGRLAILRTIVTEAGAP